MKTRSRLLALLVLASVTWPASGAIDEWFDSFEAPTGRDNWTVIVGTWPVETGFAYDGDQCLRYEPSNGKRMYRNIGSSLGKLTVEFYYMGENAGGLEWSDNNAFWINEADGVGGIMLLKSSNWDNDGTQGGPGVKLSMTDHGGSADVLHLEQYTWYKITLKLDLTPGVRTVDWYCDDVLVESGLSLFGGPGDTTVAGAVFLMCNDWEGDGGKHHSWIDAFDVVDPSLTDGGAGDPNDGGLEVWHEAWQDRGGGNRSNWTFYNSNGREWPLIYDTTDASRPDGDYYLQYAPLNDRWAYRSIGSPTKPFWVTYSYKGQDAGGDDNNDRNDVVIRNANDVEVLRLRHTNYTSEQIRVTAAEDQGTEYRMVDPNTWFRVSLHIDPRPSEWDFEWYFNDTYVETASMDGDPNVPLKQFYMKCNDWDGDGGGKHYGWIDGIVTSMDEYLLRWGGKEKPIDPCDPCDPCNTWLKLSLGSDEYESVELQVYALRGIDPFTVSVAGQGLPAGAVRVGKQDGVAHPLNAYADEVNYGIVYDGISETASDTMTAGDYKSFWLEFDASKFTPGSYSFDITAGIRSLPVRLEVVDVQMASQTHASLNMYGMLSNLENSPGPLSDQLELLSSHHVKQLQLHFAFHTWLGAVEVTRDGLGDMQVDWTGLDNRLAAPFNAGFNEIALMGYLYKDDGDWFTSLDWEDETQKKATRHEFVGKLVDHLLDLGFTGSTNGVWHYTLDEQPVSVWEDPGVLADLAWQKSMHPDLKINITVAHYKASAADGMNPYLDMWTPQVRILPTLLQDCNDGTVTCDPCDRIGYYTAGFYMTSPDVMMGRGWFAALYDVPYYSIFAYHQAGGTTPDWKIWVNVNGSPVTSGSFDALRDGFEDFAYWRKLSVLLEQAESLDLGSLTPEQQQALADAQAFHSEVFNKNNPASGLVPLKFVEGTGTIRDWLNIAEPDRWLFREVKVPLLNHILAVEAAMRCGSSDADFNGDGIVNLVDFGIFLAAWMADSLDSNWNEVCDLADDDEIELDDFRIFAVEWLMEECSHM
ncbi:MAG: hypothetical protein V3S81_00865 [Anaerolineales bacterium]